MIFTQFYDTLTITRENTAVHPPQTGDISNVDVLIPALDVLMGLAAAGVLLQLGGKRKEEAAA